jgi:hypothetical protein
MAIHLILLLPAANKLEPNLPGGVKIYSYCLGALKKVTSLPTNQLPSGCTHSANYLKCRKNHILRLKETCRNTYMRCVKMCFAIFYDMSHVACDMSLHATCCNLMQFLATRRKILRFLAM